jgi:phosphoglycerate dehydrogenase-like enzyme
MDARRLALLRPDAYIYNVGRGNAIDVPALAAALRGGNLRGAGLDVFPEEPLPEDSPLRGCPGAMRLPHVSAFAPNYLDLYLDELSPALAEAATGD